MHNMTPRKAVDQELTREMIMNVAEQLFVKEGYHHVSMRKIAQALKYSHGALYYHFKNKAELFYALVARDFSLLDDVLSEVMNKSISQDEKLKEILLGFVRFGLTHQNHYEIMFLTKDEEIKEYLSEGPNRSYEQFSQAVYKLLDQRISLREIWSMFLMLHGFVAMYCRSGQTFEDVSDLAHLHVDLILRGIRRD
jgi:AcrR family transcriptional regulator